MLKYLSFSHEEIREDLINLYISILKKENIDSKVLLILSKALVNNEVFSSSEQEFLWEMLLNYPEFDVGGLRILSGWIVYRATTIYDHEKLLEAIVNNPKIDEAGLEEVGKKISQNAKDIPDHEKLLQAIRLRSAFIP